jgi:hypothetical protein
MVRWKFVEIYLEKFGAVRKERVGCVEESRFEGVLPEYLYATATAISLVGLDFGRRTNRSEPLVCYTVGCKKRKRIIF